MESARSMMSHTNLPKALWAEAVNTATFIRNRVTSTVLKDQPVLDVLGRKPNVSGVFGCMAFAYFTEEIRR
jgi:hypothetical protein